MKLIRTAAGSEIPMLFVARHCRFFLSLIDTLLIVKCDSLPKTSLSPKTDHLYPKLTPGFDFKTLHLTVSWSLRLTSIELDGSTATTGVSNDDIQRNCILARLLLELISSIN